MSQNLVAERTRSWAYVENYFEIGIRTNGLYPVVIHRYVTQSQPQLISLALIQTYQARCMRCTGERNTRPFLGFSNKQFKYNLGTIIIQSNDMKEPLCAIMLWTICSGQSYSQKKKNVKTLLFNHADKIDNDVWVTMLDFKIRRGLKGLRKIDAKKYVWTILRSTNGGNGKRDIALN